MKKPYCAFLLTLSLLPVVLHAQVDYLDLRKNRITIIEKGHTGKQGLYIPPPQLTLRRSNTFGLDSIFEIEYIDVPVQAQMAIQRAVDVWEALLDSDVKINMRVTWIFIEDPNTLGGTVNPFSVLKNFENAKVLDAWYLPPLAEKLARTNLNGTDPDIIMTLNSQANWHFDSNPNTIGSAHDLTSVVLHEIAHGLGLASFFTNVDDNGIGTYLLQGFPEAFNTYVENLGGVSLVGSQFQDSTTAAAGQMTGDNLFFDGDLTRLRLDNQSEKRAKLHAPALFIEGSNVGHLDNLFNTLENGVHKLMTSSIGSGEIVLEPGVSREMLGDLGWLYTFIEHDGLNDIEDFTVPRTVTATISSDTQIDSNSFKLVYSLNSFEQTSDTVQMVHQGNGVFASEIPAPGTIALVSYYLIIDDEFQRQFTQPSTAPNFFFQYIARIDEEAPELTHPVPVNFITESETSINLIANASDNLGLESVVVEYDISGTVQTPINMIFTPGEFAPDRYIGIMNLSVFSLQPGDIINYRIIATDSSSNQNQTINPATGFHSIPVEGIAQAIQEYENNFEANSTDFIGDLFTRLKPVGFTDTAFHSTHPYPQAGQGNQLNFITLLRSPIIIKNDSAFIQFDEIVLVEPGEVGSVFGDQNFWDYVIVEGSIDNGATWIPFLDSYDSRDNGDWLTEWNNLNSNGQDSDGVGNSGLFVTRTIDMLTSGNFSPGDEVLIRFRMFSNPFAIGWGWTIDNLKIQKNLVVGIDEVLSDEEELKIFPNPSISGLINVRANFLKPVDKIRISVTGIFGNRVFEQEISNTGKNLDYQLDMSRIPNGIYILNVELKEGNITRKIIKAN